MSRDPYLNDIVMRTIRFHQSGVSASVAARLPAARTTVSVAIALMLGACGSGPSGNAVHSSSGSHVASMPVEIIAHQAVAAGDVAALSVTSRDAGQVTLAWSAVARADHYRLQFRPAGQTEWWDTGLHQANVFSQSVPGAGAGRWEFRLQWYSNWVASEGPVLTLDASQPAAAAATRVQAEAPLRVVTSSPGGVTVAWSSKAGANRYRLQFRPEGQADWWQTGLLDATVLQHSLPGLVSGRWQIRLQTYVDWVPGESEPVTVEVGQTGMAASGAKSAASPAPAPAPATVPAPAPVATPVATPPVAAAPVVTAPVVTAPVVTAPVVTAPVVTAPVETAVIRQPSSTASTPAVCASVTEATCRYARSLGRGINFGHMLEAPQENGYGLWLQYGWISAAKVAGFQHIRLPVRWSNHAAVTADATINRPEDYAMYGAGGFLGRVDGVLEQIAAHGMKVIVNMHHYRQLDGDDPEGHEDWVSPAVVQTRAVNLWTQIARHYVGRYPDMAFELYNEPHNALDNGRWNELYPKLLAAVRAVDPNRVVLLSTENWSNADRLASLVLPADRNIIATVHNYDPYPFTMQGTWGSPWQSRTTCCTKDQYAAIDASLNLASNWSKARGVPVYVGEFGSSTMADLASRATYTNHVRRGIESRGMPWAVWSMGQDFAVFDTVTQTFDPMLLDALMGR